MAKAWSIHWTRPLLWRMYVDQRLSTIAIAKVMDCSSRTVTYQLQRAGIELRGRGAARWNAKCRKCGAERDPKRHVAMCRACGLAFSREHLRRTLGVA